MGGLLSFQILRSVNHHRRTSFNFVAMRVHRSTGGALSTWRGRKREIGESEMNSLKRYQQAHVTKLTFYSSSDLYIHCKLL